MPILIFKSIWNIWLVGTLQMIFFKNILQYDAVQCCSKKICEHCFMKQKFWLQMGIGQHENTATTLISKSIKYHILALSNELYNFVLAQEAQNLSTKVKMESLIYYRNYTSIIWWPKTFEPLEPYKSYIPHFKLLDCGIDGSSLQ